MTANVERGWRRVDAAGRVINCHIGPDGWYTESYAKFVPAPRRTRRAWVVRHAGALYLAACTVFVMWLTWWVLGAAHPM